MNSHLNSALGAARSVPTAPVIFQSSALNRIMGNGGYQLVTQITCESTLFDGSKLREKLIMRLGISRIIPVEILVIHTCNQVVPKLKPGPLWHVLEFYKHCFLTERWRGITVLCSKNTNKFAATNGKHPSAFACGSFISSQCSLEEDVRKSSLKRDLLTKH